MNEELRELYQEVILDHYKNPRNRRVPPGANRRAEGHNPLCGDQITIHLLVENGRVAGAGFDGSGCAIATASASLMTEAILGKTPEEVENLFRSFQATVKGEGRPGDASELGKLAVFEGVREFPLRVKCATLAWHTARSALREDGGSVSTE